MAFELPPLPYPKVALDPHVSAKTLELHHGKHHAAYVKTLNKLIKNTEFELMRLEEIIQASSESAAHRKVFNNANIKVVPRPRKTDSAEVMVGDEFIGIISLDTEDGDRSFAFNMSILDIDLED